MNTFEEIVQKQKNSKQYVVSKKEAAALKKEHKATLKKQMQEVRAAKKELRPVNEELKKRRKAKVGIPKNVADTIPYLADYSEGLIEMTEGRFSKSYLLSDINYQTSNTDEQRKVFDAYAMFLNSFSDDFTIQVTIDNRTVSISEQEKKVLCKPTGDEYDKHRMEYNNILRRQITAGKNDIRQNKYITVALEAPTPIEAIFRFQKLDSDIVANLKKIGATAKVMTTKERLELLHDKFRPGYEGDFYIDFDFIKQQAISSKDYIAPHSFAFDTNGKQFKIGDLHYSVLTLSNLPASLTDEFLCYCASCNFPLVATKTVTPLSPEKALRLVRRQITGMEANKIAAEQRAVRAGYSPEIINQDLRHSLNEGEKLLDAMRTRDQKLFFVTITFMVGAKDAEELEENIKTLTSKVRESACQLKPLTFQQEDGFRLTLPLGHDPRCLSVERTLTTEATSIFMPFAVQELFQEGGFYYGCNPRNKNLILCNRTEMKTPSGFVLGSSGSGKSFAVKRNQLNVLLNDSKTGLVVIDPDGEYEDFARAFGGVVVNISANSTSHINPMDMEEDYGLDERDGEHVALATKKKKALRKKSEFILSVIDRMIAPSGSSNASSLTPQQKTIIDRCVERVYTSYFDNDFDPAFLPTLKDLQEELDKERGDEEGKAVADAVEYYTRGSMDVFSHKTNVDIKNRHIVFNIQNMGEQLRPMAQLIMFDFIWNRMIQNKAKGIRTYCDCDEIHTMFSNYHSAEFLRQLYKRGRKYGLVITGITQNIEDILASDIARSMIGNSDFLLMLNQTPEDLKALAHMLKLSPVQAQYIRDANVGCGLLKAEGTIVAFEDKFPQDSYLYSLISTKFGEVAIQETKKPRQK